MYLLNMLALDATAQPKKPSAQALAARSYCSGCHRFTEADMLDKKTWTSSVLPKMGWRLGIHASNSEPYQDLEPEEAARVKKSGIYPADPTITETEWQRIKDYFSSTAPDSLHAAENPVKPGMLGAGFEAIPITIGEQQVPQTSMLRFDTTSKLLYIADAGGSLSILDGNLALRGYWQLTAPASDLCFLPQSTPRLLTVGSIAPTELRNGAFFVLDSIPSANQTSSAIINLARPVHATTCDLDQNGKTDILICEFGHHTGSLSYFPDMDPNRKTVISPTAGARRTEVRDMNGDGRPDIVALLAQGDERLSVFLNLGKGKFQEKTIMRFTPLHGLSHFEMADFNGDGQQDMLITNGDNWDYSTIRKPYHGIRILINQGGLQFKESWFQTYYGAAKAMAADMDQDGDLDIAAISFYDDPADPANGFLYLENKGGLDFQPWSIPSAGSGKWLTMELCDFDGDAKKDIILGSYFHNAAEVAKLSVKGITEFPQVLILINQLNLPRK